jgi:hypothetical protein
MSKVWLLRSGTSINHCNIARRFAVNSSKQLPPQSKSHFPSSVDLTV